MYNTEVDEDYGSESDGTESISGFFSLYDCESPKKVSKLCEGKVESGQSSISSDKHHSNSKCQLPQTKEDQKFNSDFIVYQGVKLENLDTSRSFIDQDAFEDNNFAQYTKILDEIQPSIDGYRNNIKTYNDLEMSDIMGTEGNNNIRKAYHSETKKSMSRRENNPLLEFYDDPTSSMKKGKKNTGEKRVVRPHPKKEYYRVKLLRSWKKALRSKLKKRMRPEANEYEISFRKHGKMNYDVLCDIGETVSGPLTEAQTKRIHKEEKEGEKTFNNKYVQELFKCDVKRASFILYVNGLFYEKKCEELNKLFFFMCCNDDEHTNLCQEKWERLRKFTCTKLINNNLETSF